MKKVLISLLVVLLLLVSFFFWASSSAFDESEYASISAMDSSPQDYESGDTLSVMTYNIGYLSGMTNNLAAESDESFYSKNMERAKALFAAYHPDIVGFQEIDYASARSYGVHQLNEIAQTEGYHNVAQAVNWDKRYLPFPYWPPSAQYGKMFSGQGVMSEYPIENHERILLEAPENNPFWYAAFYIDRLAQVVKLTLQEGVQLIVINVHLEAFDAPTRMRQAKVVSKLYQKYAKDYPTLLIGDFNSIPSSEKDREEHYANDVTIQTILNVANTTTAIDDSTYVASPSSYFTFDSAEPREKIDYIFYNTNRITPIKSEVISQAGDISDHLPVYFQFVIKRH